MCEIDAADFRCLCVSPQSRKSAFILRLLRFLIYLLSVNYLRFLPSGFWPHSFATKGILKDLQLLSAWLAQSAKDSLGRRLIRYFLQGSSTIAIEAWFFTFPERDVNEFSSPVLYKFWSVLKNRQRICWTAKKNASYKLMSKCSCDTGNRTNCSGDGDMGTDTQTFTIRCP